MSEFDLIEALSLARWYEQYPAVIDGLIYLVLFTGLVHVSLGRRFHGRAGNAVSAAVGIAMAIGASVMARQRDFSLDKLGPLAWLVLLLVLAVVLYDLLRSVGLGRWTSVATSVVALVSGLSATDAGSLIAGTVLVPLARLIGLGALIAVVAAIVSRGSWRRASNGPAHSAQVPPNVVDPHGYGEPSEHWSNTLPTASLQAQIDALIVRISGHGIDQAVAPLLATLARTPRTLAVRYKRAILVLADLGYRVGRPLDASVTEVLVAANDNVSGFDRALDIARQAAHAGNAGLALDALGRMRDLERQAGTIVAALNEALVRMNRQRSDGQRGRP
ncbi:MAG: hypothetical protein ACREJO_15595 [Phycisphaerales bacterium]